MKKNIKFFYLNALFVALFEGLSEAFITPFALLFGASNTIIGSISSIKGISAIVSQYPGAKLSKSIGRKFVYVILGTVSKFIWLFFALSPLIFKEKIMVIFIVVLFLYYFVVNAIIPAWSSFVGDLIPEKVRGKIFGRRDMIISFAGMFAALIGGFYLDLFPKNSINGFLIMFLVATIFGMFSIFFFNKIKEPQLRHLENHFIDSVNADKNLKKFYYFSMFFSFAYSFASPFFVVYILKNLESSYSFLIFVSSISTLSRIVSQFHWGKITDKIGDRNVVFICALGTALIPLSFIFVTKELVWLIIPIQIYSGIVWGGFDLASFNLLLDLTKSEKREIQIANYNVLNSISLIISPLIAGFVADKSNTLLSGIPLIFAISSILRAFSIILLRGIEETRVKTKYPFRYAVKEAVTFHPVKGTIYAIRILKRKFRSL